MSGCSPTSVSPDESEKDYSEPSLQLTGRVVDQAGLLDDEAEKLLAGKLARLESETGPQFVVATTDGLDGMSIADYSLRLARGWGLGHSKRNDGVILLVAPNEMKVRIEVGYGLEGSLNDPFCAKVIRDNMLPEFRDGKLQEGIMAGANKLITKMRMSPTIELNDNEPSTASEEKMAS